MEREIRPKIKIVTDASGQHCMPDCRFRMGNYCDLYLGKVFFAGQMYRAVRLKQCIDEEVKDVK